MRTKLFLASICFIALQGCGRGTDMTPEHTSVVGQAPPVSSFVLEKVERDSGQILYKRQETTTDSVFYLEVVTYWVKAERRVDTLQNWREARIAEEDVEAQAQSIQYRLREVYGDLYSL